MQNVHLTGREGRSAVPLRGLRCATGCRVTGGSSSKRPFPRGRMLGHGPGLGGVRREGTPWEGVTARIAEGRSCLARRQRDQRMASPGGPIGLWVGLWDKGAQVSTLKSGPLNEGVQ
ncbi:hypothetical protein ACOMHN_038026 [Nucella lapillus]